MDPSTFDRSRLRFLPLAARENKFRIQDIAVDSERPYGDPGPAAAKIDAVAESIREARRRGAPVAICHGAHLIKNGLGPLLARMVEEGWLQHVATNGAGSIHDWEFAFQGRSCEDVRAYVAKGQFGIWEETGRYTALALLAGGLEGLGYGAAMGRMIVEERLRVPPRDELRELLRRRLAQASVADDSRSPAWGSFGAAADLLECMGRFGIEPGVIEIPHPFAVWSVQAACWRRGVPFTVHPGIGQDIVYTHPLVEGGALGRAAMVDFLRYAQTVRRLSSGVYLSVGSSVMSPMIFEKSVSMARNLGLQEGWVLDDFTIAVNDLATVDWDWSGGEPPVDHPAYYVRFMKSFWRMGGRLVYVGLDNRVFLTHLYQRLRG
jgi:hypothetical protein